MIRTVIVGGGMVGLTLARLLRNRGHDPVVLERAPAGVYTPRAFMLGYQGAVGPDARAAARGSWSKRPAG